MEQKILLIDSGITVQKIVALSLDKSKYSGLVASSKEEAKKIIEEHRPSLIMVSDRFEGIEWQRFPKEVEAWLGAGTKLPKMVLLASREVHDPKHYQGVLNKPFTPQALQNMISEQLTQVETISGKLNQTLEINHREEAVEVPEPLHLNMEEMMEQTPPPLRATLENLWEEAPKAEIPKETRAKAESVSDLWGMGKEESVSEAPNQKTSKNEPEVLDLEESLAYKSLLENQVQQQLETQNLNDMVEKVLSKLLPPMVERLVNERLDMLLKEENDEMEREKNLHL
jgi:CheY-like chemotaxis protein